MRALACARRASSIATLLVAFGGCTFGSLADYEIRQCKPAASQAEDECTAIDREVGSCMPLQCDPVTRRCVRKMRDDDRDGDPDALCTADAQGDCDDRNAAVSSLGVGRPAVLAGAALPTEPAKISLSSDGGDAPTIAFVSKGPSGDCLSVARADVPSTTSLGGCQLLASAASLFPTQIDARRVGDSGFIAAFVDVSTCSAGRLGFAYGNQHAIATSCGEGVARPSLTMLDGVRAAIAWYAAPSESRASALDHCATAKPAALRVQLVPTVAAPSLAGAPGMLTNATVSMAPPAMLVREGLLFVASPAGDDATLWALDPTKLAPKAALPLPGLAGARSTALAAHRREDGRTRFAVVAESGCESQAIRMAIVDFDPSTSSFVAVLDVEIAPGSGSYQWQPSVAWVAARKRFVVAWLTTGPKPLARFVSEEGVAGAPPFELTDRALTARALSSGRIALVGSGAGGQQLLASPARCP